MNMQATVVIKARRLELTVTSNQHISKIKVIAYHALDTVGLDMNDAI